MGLRPVFLPQLVLISFLLTPLRASGSSEEDTAWAAFKRANGRRYKDKAEESQRRSIFQQNIEKIFQHNIQRYLGKRTYEKKVNQYADLTDDELMQTDCCSITNPGKKTIRYNQRAVITRNDLDYEEEVPDEIDYRELGAVTPVKVQGMCASCWAFGTIGAIESHYYLAHHELTPLSEQQLTDCSMDDGGCRGGHHTDAYYYILKNGLTKSKVYPYRGRPDKCHYNNETMKTVEIEDYKNIPSGDEEEMKRVVGTIGPVTVGFFVDPDMKRHKSGVYYNPKCVSSPKQINHAAVVVGYGTDKNTKMDYWIVKNSGGRKWGDEGYIWIARNQGNMCNIASFATYPVIKGDGPNGRQKKPGTKTTEENTPKRKHRRRKHWHRNKGTKGTRNWGIGSNNNRSSIWDSFFSGRGQYMGAIRKRVEHLRKYHFHD